MSDIAGVAEFARQLEELGYVAEVQEGDKLSYRYEVPCGGWRGKSLQLGFEVPTDFPRTPPHGPHFSPKLLPENTNVNTHPARVHASSFGPEWMHWSRPIPKWDESDRSVATYLAWVKGLFCIVPIEEVA